METQAKGKNGKFFMLSTNLKCIPILENILSVALFVNPKFNQYWLMSYFNNYLLFWSQIAEIQSLVSGKMDITCLEKEYPMDDYIYQSKIKVHINIYLLMVMLDWVEYNLGTN